MSKTESYKEALVCLLSEFLKTGIDKELREYLALNSNLPGPRGNLELSYVFAEVAEDFSTENLNKMWELVLALADISANEAPVNNPMEFIPFCGAVAIGAMPQPIRALSGKPFRF